MGKSGITPVFGSTERSRFLWPAAWLSWGTPVTTPQAGDVVVFDFGFGDRQVTLFESDNGNGTLKCRGGNQSHEVNVTNFPKSAFMGIRHPIVSGAVKPEQAVQQVMPISRRFAACVALVFEDEGSYYSARRTFGGTHSLLPVDVSQASQDKVVAIY
jgi:hypothetical protein